jgi:hypothetical protein
MNPAFSEDFVMRDVDMSSPPVGLLSPSPSAASTRSPNNVLSLSRHLPKSRTHPLKPGSPKEITLINYIDSKLLRITRRYAKKFSNSTADADSTKGYVSFDEVVEDLDAVFDVAWISATPTLQVPYLLTVAGLFCSYMQAFPFAGNVAMFKLLKKLDEGFSSLLRFQIGDGYHVTTTDKVRIKSLVEETRVVAVEVASETGHGQMMDDEDSEDGEVDDDDEIPDQVSMSLSTIYRRTLDLLGDSLVDAVS